MRHCWKIRCTWDRGGKGYQNKKKLNSLTNWSLPWTTSGQGRFQVNHTCIYSQTKLPSIIVQFEDFKNPFPALERYQNRYSCFNDDIQGTGAVILSGIINALKQTGKPVKDQRAVFMGAGSAGVGVARQIVEFFVKEGLSEDQARKKFWFVDTKVSFYNSFLEVNAQWLTFERV